MLAPANTSAGAPCSIWAVSVSVPANDQWNVVPGCLLANSAPIFGKTLVSDAAASTVSGAPPEELDEADELDEQAASSSTVAAPSAATRRRRLNRRPPCRRGSP